MSDGKKGKNKSRQTHHVQLPMFFCFLNSFKIEFVSINSIRSGVILAGTNPQVRAVDVTRRC